MRHPGSGDLDLNIKLSNDGFLYMPNKHMDITIHGVYTILYNYPHITYNIIRER